MQWAHNAPSFCTRWREDRHHRVCDHPGGGPDTPGWSSTITWTIWLLVQDSAPAHTAQLVQNLLRRKIPKFVPKEKWPSSSPDLNPSGYWLWSVMEKANVPSQGSFTGLKRAIRRAAAAISPEESRSACARFRGRIEQV